MMHAHHSSRYFILLASGKSTPSKDSKDTEDGGIEDENSNKIMMELGLLVFASLNCENEVSPRFTLVFNLSICPLEVLDCFNLAN